MFVYRFNMFVLLLLQSFQELKVQLVIRLEIRLEIRMRILHYYVKLWVNQFQISVGILMV